MVKYLKKVWGFILVLTLIFTIFPVNSYVKAEDTIIATGNCGTATSEGGTVTFADNATWILYSSGKLVISGTGEIGSNYNEKLFYPYRQEIKAIEINEGITSFAFTAFSCMKGLIKIKLPETLESTNIHTFSGCTALTDVTLSNSMTSIEAGMFNDCTALSTITLPDKVTSIGSGAFYGCTLLSNITLSNSLTTIGMNAFYNCSSLKKINIPSSVTDIDDTAFSKCDNLTIVSDSGENYAITYAKKNNIAYSYPMIDDAQVTVATGNYIANRTEQKPSVTVTYEGATLTEGTDYTLEYKDNVNAGEATVTVTGIHKYGGSQTKKFTITGTSIENAKVALKRTIYTYDGSAKTPSVKVTLDGATLKKDEDYTLTYDGNQDDGTAYAVVTGIGMYTGTVKKSFVILPYNSGMDSVYPDGTMISNSGVYGVTDDENNEVEYCCPSTSKVIDVKIPATITDEDGTVYKVTSIGKEAFYKNTKIETLVIGNNVATIEAYAFYGCKNLKSITMGKGVELIGAASFRKCTKLTSVTLPKSMKELGKNAFYGCKKLKNITIKSSAVVDVNDGAIKGISKKAVIKVPKKLFKKYKKEFNKKSGYTSTMTIKKMK